VRRSRIGAGLVTRFAALRGPRFRRYWLGSAASVGAFQLLIMGQGWLVYELSGSPLQLGFLGAASSIPTIIASLAGGVIADRVDRRRLLVATSLLTALLLALLAALDGSEVVRVWHVLLIAGTIALVVGFDFPARMAFFPSLVGRSHMMSAVALNAILWQGTRMFLPALGGIVIALSDTWVVFALGAAGFAIMAAVMVSLGPGGDAQVPSGPSGREFLEGLRFVATERLFLILILMTYATTFFGISYVQLMPAFARLLGVGETGFGLILSSTGIGSVTGTLIVASLQRSPYLGRLMLAALGGAALAFLAFNACVALLAGHPAGYPAALLCSVVAAMCTSMFLVSSMTVMQLAVPDRLRGRVMGLHGICFSLIPLGGLLGGAVASATTPPFAAAINAVLLGLVILFVAATQPAVRQLRGTRAGLANPDQR